MITGDDDVDDDDGLCVCILPWTQLAVFILTDCIALLERSHVQQRRVPSGLAGRPRSRCHHVVSVCRR
jgi:hypothetical protein